MKYKCVQLLSNVLNSYIDVVKTENMHTFDCEKDYFLKASPIKLRKMEWFK